MEAMKRMRKWTGIPVLGIVAGALVLLMSGCTASKKPSKLETTLANIAKDVVIPLEAQNLKNPATATDENIQAGRQTYLQQCALCHAAGGHAATKLSLSMYPPAMDLNSPHVQRWTDAELSGSFRTGSGSRACPLGRRLSRSETLGRWLTSFTLCPSWRPFCQHSKRGPKLQNRKPSWSPMAASSIARKDAGDVISSTEKVERSAPT
jgi:mono/diheme cytochrome c family protein